MKGNQTMEFRLNGNRAPQQPEASARALTRLGRTARIVASYVIILVVLPVAAFGQDQSVEEVLQRLQQVYAKECCFKASFDQLTVNVAMDMKDRFRGTMFVRKPGSIALDVDNPEPQRVVVQGREYTVYFPAEGNTVRGEIPAELNVESFFSFFTNIAELGKNYQVQLPSRPLDSEERLTLLELVDKKKTASTFRVLLGIDRETFTIRRAIIYDALGNYNRFDLTNIEFLKSIPASYFEPASPGDGVGGTMQNLPR